MPAPARLPAAAPPRGTPVPVATAPLAKHGGDDEEHSILHQRRKSSSGPIIAIACVVIGGMLIGGVVVMMSLSGGTDKTEIAATPSKKPAKAAADAGGDSLSSQQLNMTKAVKSWRDADKGLSLKGLISFEIKRVYWLDGPNASAPDLSKMEAAAADMGEAMAGELAKEIEKAPGKKKMQDAARDMAKAAKSIKVDAPRGAAGPQLCVELSITNVSSAPLTMTSWNSRGKTGAWVVDDKFKLIGAASGGSGSLSIAPNETITDTLQFSTGSKDFSELRLVLPYTALARSGQSGFKLDSATLAGTPKAKPETAVAKTPVAEKPQPAEPMEEPKEPAIIDVVGPNEPPAGVATNKTPKIDDGEPTEDIRDIIKKGTEKKE
jgi:hypothetical protein